MTLKLRKPECNMKLKAANCMHGLTSRLLAQSLVEADRDGVAGAFADRLA